MLTQPETNVTVSDNIFVRASRVTDSNRHTAETDGRVERSVATRRRILDATRALLISGITEPTASRIADRAGITTRTLFRHFEDMASLSATLVREAQAGAQAVMDEPFHGDPEQNDWHDLLEQIIERRVRVYESLLPLYVSSAWLGNTSDTIKVIQREGIKRRRRRLQDVLPEQVAADQELFEALDATLSIEFWLSLRKGQNLGVDRATGVVRRAVHQLSVSCAQPG